MYTGIPRKQTHKYNSEERQKIWELLLSLNKGNSREAESRVDIAIKQYEQFKEKVIDAEVK